MKKLLSCLCALLLIAGFAVSTTTNTAPVSAQSINASFSASFRERDRGGEIKQYATGFLYGLSEDNIPTSESISALKPSHLATKNKDGLQHPTGDAWRVSETFFEAGGQEIQIYLTDYYPDFAYNGNVRPSMEDYLEKAVIPTIRFLKENGDPSQWAFVPFNEPDWIWYSLNSTQYNAKMPIFLADWKMVYDAIKAEWSEARVVGPNYAYYFETAMNDFIKFASQNDCMPEVISWHELGRNDFDYNWYTHVEKYRALAERYNISDTKVVINEYAEAKQVSVPGELVRYLAGFENEEIYACLPYWNIANNMNDLVADANTPNSAWWLYKWYADMSGIRVNSYGDSGTRDGLSGLTSYDEQNQIARTIFGGYTGNIDFAYDYINTTCFADAEKLRVTVKTAPWSAYDGEATETYTIFDRDVEVTGGTLSFTLEDLNRMDAYTFTITAAEGASGNEAFIKTIEAESTNVSRINAPTVSKAGILSSGAGHFGLSHTGSDYASETVAVAAKMNGNSSISTVFSIPKNGEYELKIVYGTNSRSFMTQNLILNEGAPLPITYSPTISGLRQSTLTIPLQLVAGDYTVTLSNNEANLNIDRLTICSKPDEVKTILTKDYSTLTNLSLNQDGLKGFSKSDSKAVFNITENVSGYYKIAYTFTGSGNIRTILNGTATGTFNNERANDVVFLVKGVNRLELLSDGDITLKSIGVSPSSVVASATADISTATLGGTATLESSEGIPYIALGGGSANYAEIKLNVESAGEYMLLVSYSSNDKKGTHIYNVDAIDPYLQMSVNGNEAQTHYYRSTFHWDAYVENAIKVTLIQGENTIKFYNDNSYGYNGILSTQDPAPRLTGLRAFALTSADELDFKSDVESSITDEGKGCKSSASATNAIIASVAMLSAATALILLRHKKAKIK